MEKISYKRLAIYLVLCVLSVWLFIDSIQNWKALNGCKSPMNYWYTTYSIACIIASFESTMKEIARPIAYNKCNRLWECTQGIIGYFVIGTIPFGILWFIRSWTYDPYSIPTRLKLQFMTILITWGLVLITLFVWMMVSISGMLIYLKRMKQNGQMQLQLNHLVDKIYDTQFDFKSIKKRLKHEFYRLPIKEKEIKLLEEKFTKTFENDPVTCDPENPAECSYCYTKLQPGDIVTNLPICNHGCHFSCLSYWLKTEHSCPCCKVNIRKSLVEHYHGHFTYRMEKFYTKKDNRQRLDNDLSIDRAKTNQKLIDNEK